MPGYQSKLFSAFLAAISKPAAKSLQKNFFNHANYSAQQSHVVYRGMKGDRDQVHNQGVYSSGDNRDLFAHVQYNHPHSVYIATTTNISETLKFAGDEGFVAAMNRPKIVVDVPSTSLAFNLEQHTPDFASWEESLAAIQHIPSSDILGTTKTKSAATSSIINRVYKFDGAFKPNPAYLPRNYSFTVLSADPEQAQAFDAILTKRHARMDEQSRYLSYEEVTNEFAPAMEEVMKRYDVTHSTFHLVINGVPKDKTNAEAIQMLQGAYDAQLRKDKEVVPTLLLFSALWPKLDTASKEKAVSVLEPETPRRTPSK